MTAYTRVKFPVGSSIREIQKPKLENGGEACSWIILFPIDVLGPLVEIGGPDPDTPLWTSRTTGQGLE